jgi:hypothetical protein
MRLKTTVNVNGKGFYDEPAFGRILASAPKEDGSLLISGQWEKEDGTPIKSISETFTSEEVEALYVAIKSSLTANLNGVLALWEQMYKAFVINMAGDFGINTNQVEVID